MIGRKVFLFPEGGAGFQQSLKAAALYADKIYAFPPEGKILPLLEERKGSGMASSLDGYPARVRRYIDSLRQTQSDMVALGSAGLLGTDLGQIPTPLFTEKMQYVFDKIVHDFGSSEPRPRYRGLLLALTSQNTSGSDWLEYCLKQSMSKNSDDPTIRTALFRESIFLRAMVGYLSGIIATAEMYGIPAMSWAPEYDQGLWSVRDLFWQDQNNSILNNNGDIITSGQLTETIVERSIPAFDRLEIDDILMIREKRNSELESFRTAVQAMTASMAMEGDIEDRKAYILRMVQKSVDPAIDELKRALRTTQIDAVKKLGRSGASLAGASVTISLSLALGAPLDVSALLASAGALAGAVIDAALDREKVVRGSPWGLLMRFSRRR